MLVINMRQQVYVYYPKSETIFKRGLGENDISDNDYTTPDILWEFNVNITA